MARYFFDCYDGVNFLGDLYGIVLVDASEAADHANEIAKNLMMEASMDSGAMSVAVQVRSSDGVIFHTVQGNLVSKSIATEHPERLSVAG